MSINYNNSRIYKIVSPSTDKIYIGSTTQILCKRIAKHLIDYRAYIIDNTKKYLSSYEIIKLGDYSIKLIEECNFENREQLRQREGYYIKFYKDIIVNKLIAGRTRKEYLIDNKEHIAERSKQYVIDNKEQIRQYAIDNAKHIAEVTKQYRIEHKEQAKQYQMNNKEHLNELMRQRRQANKNKIWLNELTTL